MPNPKRRHSRARRDKRRSQWKLAPPTLVPCGTCEKPRRPHYVCPHCGSYDGKQVISLRRGQPTE